MKQGGTKEGKRKGGVLAVVKISAVRGKEVALTGEHLIPQDKGV